MAFNIQEHNDRKFLYMYLSRLQGDCEYFLGYGNRSVRHLPSNSVQEHIYTMKKIYNKFSIDEKPEWLTWEQILDYEKEMNK